MNCSVVTNFNTPVVVINFVHPSIQQHPLTSAAVAKSDQLLTTRLLTIKRQCLKYVYRIRKYVIFPDLPVPSHSQASVRIKRDERVAGKKGVGPKKEQPGRRYLLQHYFQITAGTVVDLFARSFGFPRTRTFALTTGMIHRQASGL